MPLRDHQPIIIDQFNGLWQRGDVDNTPLDHFQDCNNIHFTGSNQFQTRDGIDLSQNVAVPVQNVKRIYNYPTQNANTYIVLTNVGGVGYIYHVVNSNLTYGPILSIPNMTDFAFLPYAGRAYISPFTTFPVSGLNVEKGLPGEIVYVYAGDGSPARPAAGAAPVAQGINPIVVPTYSAPTVVPTIAVGAAWPSGQGQITHGILTNVTIQYTYIYQGNIESLPSPVSTPAITIDATHGWNATITTGGFGVIARKLYFSSASGGAITTNAMIINDNVTTNISNITGWSINYAAYTSVPLILYDSSTGLFTMINNTTPPQIAPLAPPALQGGLTIANGIAGHTDPGFHLFGFVTQSVSGYLSPPGAITGFTTSATSSVSFGNVPTINISTTTIQPSIPLGFSDFFFEEEDEEDLFLLPENQLYLKETFIEDPDDRTATSPSITVNTVASPYIVKRFLVASKVINNYNGNPLAYQLFFVPNAVINNNTDTFLNNVSFFDADLLADASHLLNNFPSIAAGAVLTLYRNRMCVMATYNNISAGFISSPGEPEAIDQINGLIIVPLDGNPITNAAEMRDVLYVTKRSRTVAYVDNGGQPATWQMSSVDNALGTSVHGISTVLDSGNTSVDFLIICTYQGVLLFNGKYITPELTWKIEAFWKTLSQTDFRYIQVVNAPIQKEIYIVLPNRSMIVGNYSNGMDYRKIRWTPWSFSTFINSVAIANINDIIIGANIN